MSDPSGPEPVLHEPVMVEEVLECLAPQPGHKVLDATVGTGGHAVRLLERIRPGGVLIGVDRDPEALETARRRLAGIGGEFHLFRGPYSRIADYLRSLGWTPEGALDAVLFDLGVSTLQLETARRGFSFQREGPLSMLMDPEEGESAADLLRRLSAREIEEILRAYGEEPHARRIAKAIERRRREAPIETTGELSRLVEEVVPRRGRRIHPATRTFQALRIAVNKELEHLRLALRDLDRFVRPGGKVAVLSYHSLEDREVKRILGEGVRQGLWRWNPPGVLEPSAAEVAANPRARSAKLRCAVRTGGD